jgi:hypothetical protein
MSGNKCKVLGVVPGQGVYGSPRVMPHALQLRFAVSELNPLRWSAPKQNLQPKAIINLGAIWQQGGITLQCFKS